MGDKWKSIKCLSQVSFYLQCSLSWIVQISGILLRDEQHYNTYISARTHNTLIYHTTPNTKMFLSKPKQNVPDQLISIGPDIFDLISNTTIWFLLSWILMTKHSYLKKVWIMLNVCSPWVQWDLFILLWSNPTLAFFFLLTTRSELQMWYSDTK